MPKILLVAWREAKQRLQSRGFIMGSIAMPVILIIVWAVTGVLNTSPAPAAASLPQETLQETIGYVDQAGVIAHIPMPVPPDLFHAYPTVDAAEQALAAGELAAYYVVSPDYVETGEVRRVSPQIPTQPADLDFFKWVLAGNLAPQAGPDQLARLRTPLGAGGLRVINLTEEGQESREGGQSGNMMPFIVAFLVMMPLFTGGSYLLQSLIEEKSNRVMEILLTTLRPYQLLTGKLVGLGALTLIQYAIWAVILGVAMLVIGQDVGRLLNSIDLSPQEVLLIVPFALGGYLLYAAVMAGIGALSVDLEGGRTWIFVITLPIMIPIYLWMPIVSNPHGPLATALSLFPFSAPVAMLMRLTSASVPVWQTVLSLGLVFLGGLGVLWLMARLFRVQTLLSGESISMRRFWAALRG